MRHEETDMIRSMMLRWFRVVAAVMVNMLRRWFKTWTSPGSGPFLAGC
jgi:hypothetical protein